MERQKVEVGHEVHETTRCRDEDITAHLELLALVLGRCTAVDNARAQHGAVAETASLIEDLAGEFASGADDENKRLSADAVGHGVVARWVGTRGSELAGLAHQARQDGDKESSSLAGT